MNHYSALVVRAALFFSLSLMGCGTKPPCGPATCTGCCDVTGACNPGTASATCGNGGAACLACSSACTAGICTSTSNGGGTAATGGGTENDAGTGGGSSVGGGSATGGGSAAGGGTAAAGGGFQADGGARCTATPVICRDDSIQTLNFFTIANSAAITEEGDGGVFVTHIDARAGGMTANTSYMYGRFENTGLQKVAIDDESALNSMDWDIAVRRYVIRINSGVAGPSCVEAARVPPGTTFDALTQVPAGLSWRTEAYFSPSCDFVTDTSGIGGPGTALSSYWSYTACVKMTNNVFVIHTRDGRYLKFQVLSYYDPASQIACNTTDSAPPPNGSGNVRVRWAFIPGP